MSWLTTLLGPVLGNVVGGGASQPVLVGSLFLITILVVLLLAARLDLSLALVIVSPAIIVASFGGLLPPLAFVLWCCCWRFSSRGLFLRW